MRPDLSPGTLALLASGRYDVHWTLHVANGSGTLVDLTDRIEFIGGALPSPDQPIASLDVEFLREPNDDGGISLAPLMGASELNRLDDGSTYSALLLPGRAVVAKAAITARGGARPGSGFYEIFRGRVGRVGTSHHPDGRDNVRITCLDQSGALQKTKSEAAYTYEAGTSIEAAIQAVLNNNGWSSIALNCPVPTGKVLAPDYAPGVQKTVWDQVWALAQSIGWVVWWRYQENGTAALTLFEPAREKDESDFTFDVIRDLSDLDVDEHEIFNVAHGVIVDADGEIQEVGPVEDAESIAKYGGIRHSFWVVEDEESPVRTEEAMLALLTAAVSDTAEPDAVQSVTIPAFLFGEVSVDRYTFPANDHTHDDPQLFAPFSIEFSHRIGEDHSGTMETRGKPTAGAKVWRGRGGAVRPPTPPPVSTYGLRDFREIEASGPGKRRWGWTERGERVASVWFAAVAYTTPFNLPDAWAATAARVEPIPPGQNWIEIDVPAADQNVLLQVEPRKADLTVHDADVIERVQVFPVTPYIDVAFSASIVENLVDLSLTLTAGAGSMPYPATARVYEGTSSGTLLAEFAFATDGTRTKAHASALGGRALPAVGKKVWTVVVTDRTGTVYTREAMVDAPRLPRFDGVRSALTVDLLSVNIYGTVIDPAGLGGTLEYWLPPDQETAADPSGSPTGSVVIAAGSMPFAMGPGSIPAFGGVKTVGNSFTVVLKFTATDGRTTGAQPFPLSGSMQFLVDQFGQLRAGSVHNGLVLAQQYRPYFLGTGAPSEAPAVYGTDRYFDTAALQPYRHTGSTWVLDTETPAISYAPILRAGVVTATVLAADAAVLTLVGANRVKAENVDVGNLSLIADDAGAIVRGSFINEDGDTGLNLDAVPGQPVLWAPGISILKGAAGPSISGYVPAGGAAADVNAGSTIIEPGRITVSAASTFAPGYNPSEARAAADSAYAEAIAAGASAGDAQAAADAAYAAAMSAQQQASSASAVIRAASPPSQRAGGLPLVAGDIWIHTTDGDAPYTWSGSQWIRAYTRIDGGNIVTGTVAANRVSIGAGTAFGSGYDPSTKETPAGSQAKADAAQAAAEAVADTAQAAADAAQAEAYAAAAAAIIAYDEAIAAGANADEAQEAADAARVRADAAQDDADAAAAAASAAAAATAQSTANSKVQTFRASGPGYPSGTSVGDILYAADQGDHPYRWNGSAWISIRDATIATAASAAADAYAAAIAAGNTATDAQAAANAAAVVAGSASAIIFSGSAPSTRVGGAALVQGDQWIHNGQGNRPYIWNGTGWVAAYTIIDGGAIQTGEIRSIIYAPGSAGWALNTNGNAELNNVVVRGTVFATDGEFAGVVSSNSFTALRARFFGSINVGTADFRGVEIANDVIFWRDTNEQDILSLGRDTSGNVLFDAYAGEVRTRTPSGSPHRFFSGSSERIRVTGGSLGSGITSLQIAVGPTGNLFTVYVDSATGFLRV